MTAVLIPTTPAPERHVVVRSAMPADHATVVSLLERCGLHTTSFTLEGATYWIALLAGQPVGTIGLEHGDGVSLIRSTAVVPEARGSGVGRALAQSALTLATLRGDAAVFLFSSDSGEFWTRFGFREVAVDELVGALPDVPQVRSGKLRGWLADEVAWRLDLTAVQGSDQV